VSELHIDLSGGQTANGGGASAPALSADRAAPELPLLDLPAGAEQLPNGDVCLTLDYPVTIAVRGKEDDGETITALTLRRLAGVDLRRITDASAARGPAIALAAASGLTQARMALVLSRMDASDVNAANMVVGALLDIGEGLPERAREDGREVVLPLLFPVGERDEIRFRRLNGADLQAIAAGKDTLTHALGRAAGMSPVEARELFDALDGADAMGVSRVVGFLSGSGRTSGR